MRRLARAFIDWLKVRYPEDRQMIDDYLAAQNFEAVLADLLSVYGPPDGDCLLAKLDGEPAGIVMFKPKGNGDCEMNRMFVAESARGHGVGYAIGRRCIELAGDAGYTRMILAAAGKHYEALPLYEKLGFVEDPTLPDTGAGDMEIRMKIALT